jgi:hypothetical protein
VFIENYLPLQSAFLLKKVDERNSFAGLFKSCVNGYDFIGLVESWYCKESNERAQCIQVIRGVRLQCASLVFICY